MLTCTPINAFVPLFAIFFIKKGREVGAARYYTCNDGYVMVGKVSRAHPHPRILLDAFDCTVYTYSTSVESLDDNYLNGKCIVSACACRHSACAVRVVRVEDAAGQATARMLTFLVGHLFDRRTCFAERIWNGALRFHLAVQK